MSPSAVEPVDVQVRRLVEAANSQPEVVERVCRELCDIIAARFVQPAIDRGDPWAEFTASKIAAYCNDLANFAVDNASELVREER